ncbi:MULTISPECIES: 3-deoxy-manno-octulosonate cytidylyltransferase [Pseudoalteromonas]|uniref:3-deoxy-manno-octulosonate cytidylyltransferase n=1 Tax=Pseudoalteromonas aurantia 208 TaxID=1314867 RepID=A0ABR9EA88_9GAMM|nr:MULTISPECIES: 3-deoxy-manno-octulosonate cytidylyltransferase [Pseudoalteromonas]MBE0367873.1 3-deoxy-manno-octulosonate cytidylyltransferase (CMP-KDO synthetase) [Pseudoalteromonas aurantia 208]MBQ4845588.1 3-deoxy-manno-octulosonate cytidylyltransferase [Pseudoalteromonas sp. MMG005]MBQ4848896.1 3-deoxy-manno-octulosonate cytidylyltransferase [Pseudoalteromonas sp. MMG012]
MAFVVVIPARYASSRLPGKPLADICGKPMIQHVFEQASRSGANAVYIATDHQAVFDVAMGFTKNVLMTRIDHQSGTERLAEVVEKLNLGAETIVVNVQGDEPLLEPENIDQVAQLLANSSAPMATLSVDIENVEEVLNPNAVKVVQDAHNNALYFSRASIPFQRNSMLTLDKNSIPLHNFQRHVGIYAYRAGFIQEYLELPVSPLEVQESLEQLRVLYHGKQIKIAKAIMPVHAGVDTPEDLARVVELLNA